MDNQKRQLLAVGLVLLLTAIYWTFFTPTPPPRPTSTWAPSVVPDAGTVAVSPPAPPPPPTPAAPEDKVPEQRIERPRPLVHYVFSTRGAGLVEAKLLAKKMREQLQLSVSDGLRLLVGGKIPPPPQMDMARPVPDQPLPLAIAVEGSQPLSPNAGYLAAPASTGDSEATFTVTRGSGGGVKKV